MNSAQLPPFQYLYTKVFMDIPADAKKVILAGSADGSASFSMDDKLTISGPDDGILFVHDFRRPEGGIQAMPPKDVTDKFQSLIGTKGYISGSAIDLQGNSMGGTEVWICFFS